MANYSILEASSMCQQNSIIGNQQNSIIDNHQNSITGNEKKPFCS